MAETGRNPHPARSRQSRRTIAFSTWRDSAAASTKAPTVAATWSLKNQGIDAVRSPLPGGWRESSDGVLYALMARRSVRWQHRQRRRRRALSLHRWRRTLAASCQLPEGSNGPNGLAIDPKEPNRLYLAAWGREVRQGGARRRHLPLHGRRQNVAPRAFAGSAHLRCDDRSTGRQTALRRRIRIFGMAIVRFAAKPGIALPDTISNGDTA